MTPEGISENVDIRLERRSRMNTRSVITLLGISTLLMATAVLQAQENAGEKYLERYTKEVFEEADTNNDGYISREEAKAASNRIERELYGSKRFDAADIDGDGKLSMQEVGKYKKAEMSEKGMAAEMIQEKQGETEESTKSTLITSDTGEKYHERYTKEVFEEADTDNDGYISWEEARAASARIERDLYGSKRFNAADINGDGKLSMQEVGKYKRAEMSHKSSAIDKTKRRKGTDSAGTGETVDESGTAGESTKAVTKQSKHSKKRAQIKSTHSVEEKSGGKTGTTDQN